MSMPVEVLEAGFLRLPTADRMMLLHKIIASLDADQARGRTWDQLAAERQADAEADKAALVPGQAFIAQLRAELA